MSGLAARLKALTRPTAEEERLLLRSANGALIRTTARVLRPERGELERVLRGVPAGRSARRFGVAATPSDPEGPDRTSAVRRKALGALLVAGMLGGAGLAKAAPSVRAALASGLEALTAERPAPTTLAEVEAATCDGPADAPAGGAGGPGLGGEPGLGAPAAGPSMQPAGNGAAALAVPVPVSAHPNPRLVHTVGGLGSGGGGATPLDASAPALAGPGAPRTEGSGPGAPGARSASGGGGGVASVAGGAPLAPLPAVPGLDGPSTFTSSAPMTDPTVSGPVDHDVNDREEPLAVDQTSLPEVCPVWPGEPASPSFSVAAAPPPLQPAAVVATAPSVMGIPLAVAAPVEAAPRSRPRSAPARAAAAADPPLAVPSSGRALPRPAPSRRMPADLSAGWPVDPLPAVPAAPSAPSSPAAPVSPPAPAASGAGTSAPSVDAQALLNEVVFGAGRGAAPPDPADCDPADTEP